MTNAAAVRPKSRKSPLNMKPEKIIISEAQRQNQVIVTLRSLGYVVLEIGQKRQPIFCNNVVGGQRCGKKHWPVTTGNTNGAPDLIVSHARWGAGAMMGLEMKTPDTVRRREQLALATDGITVIVETVQDALEAVRHLEQQWDVAPLPAMSAYLDQSEREDQ